MVSFDYLIHDAMGLHARPVGLVVKAVKPYQDSQITITHNGRQADAKRMFARHGAAGQAGRNHHRLRTGQGTSKRSRSDSRYF